MDLLEIISNDNTEFLVTDKACKARLIAHFSDKNYKINILYSNEFVQRVLEKGFEPVHNTVFVTPN